MTEIKTTQKNFRFSDETVRQFEELAKHFGETDSDVIRRLIAERYVALFGVPREAQSRIWRAFDSIYGADHGEPIPYDGLPKDVQKHCDDALDALAELKGGE